MPVDVTVAVVPVGVLVVAVDVAAVELDAALEMVELMDAFPVSLAALSANRFRT
jgi:hypothetical protein